LVWACTMPLQLAAVSCNQPHEHMTWTSESGALHYLVLSSWLPHIFHISVQLKSKSIPIDSRRNWLLRINNTWSSPSTFMVKFHNQFQYNKISLHFPVDKYYITQTKSRSFKKTWSRTIMYLSITDSHSLQCRVITRYFSSDSIKKLDTFVLLAKTQQCKSLEDLLIKMIHNDLGNWFEVVGQQTSTEYWID